MRKKNKYGVTIFILVVLLISFFSFQLFIQNMRDEDVVDESYDMPQEEIDYVESDSRALDEEAKGDEIIKEEQAELLKKFKIDISFLSQAPFGVWDEYHDDACEEASLIMLEYYLSGKELNNEIGESQIQGMIRFQLRNYGDFKDTSVAETVQLAKDFYDRYNLEVVYDFEKERIKKEVARGNPVILPAAGRILANPYYTPPGPLYHNLVVVGYDGDMIITHDPGTKRGANYKYHIDVLYDAIHDFTGKKEDILSGRKAMIIVK